MGVGPKAGKREPRPQGIACRSVGKDQKARKTPSEV